MGKSDPAFEMENTVAIAITAALFMACPLSLWVQVVDH